MIHAKMIDETTLRLDGREIQILQNNAPYLIAMHVRDLAEIVIDEDIVKDESESLISIPEPTNEPTVGVIDTQFDKRVYFS